MNMDACSHQGAGVEGWEMRLTKNLTNSLPLPLPLLFFLKAFLGTCMSHITALNCV